MSNKFKKAFKNEILGQDGSMEECWSNIADDDPRLIQLANDHPDYKKKCVPIIIHGDGVPCTNNHSLDAISFESILAKRGMGTACSTLDYMFFITGVFTQTIDSLNANGLGKTKTQMWKLIVHSIRACYFGFRPDKDPLDNEFPSSRSLNFKERGHELMGGYVLVPWILKGDMDFQINHFNFQAIGKVTIHVQLALVTKCKTHSWPGTISAHKLNGRPNGLLHWKMLSSIAQC